MGISKTSLLFCFGLLVGFHECTQDFFFDDQGFITDKSGSKEVTKQLKEREIVLISDDTDLLNDGSGEGSGGTGEGSSGSGEGSGEAEILYSTSSNDAVQSTASEHVVTTTDDLLTITNQEDEVTISHGAITDESGDGSGDIDDVEQSGSGEGNEETGLPDFELVTDAVHSAATESLKAPNKTTESWTTESWTTEMLQGTTENSQHNETNSQFIKLRVCMVDFVCKAGSRGPCKVNETLVVINDADNFSSTSNKMFGLSCSALSCYPWKGCFKAKQLGSSLAGMPYGKCVPNANTSPCSGFPASYRYDEEKKRCSPVLQPVEQKPYRCGPNQSFIGMPFLFGWCQCNNRQYLPYIGDASCYRPFTRGPCQHEEWLVPSRNRTMNCKRCPCPDKADGRHVYWPGDSFGEPGCYQTFTTGPCPEGGTFIVTDYFSGKANCSSLPRMRKLK